VALRLGWSKPLLAAALRQQAGDLPVSGKRPCSCFENTPPVDDDVELPASSARDLSVDPERLLKLGRETRGSCVVPASGGAVEDLDGHRNNPIDLQFPPVPAALREAG
jgi:hypothetical protein